MPSFRPRTSLAIAGALSIALLSAGIATTGSRAATVAKDESAIRHTMSAYNVALNGGRTAAVLPLYTPDGIFMAPFSESSIGIPAIKLAYDKVFQELKFNVKFTIREVV